MAGVAEVLFTGGSFYEGPRWHEGEWYASDFYRHGVFAYTPAGEERLVVEVPTQPSGLGWAPDGSLLVVSMRDQLVLRLAPGSTTPEPFADLAGLAVGHCNDMVVDAAGGAYVGCFGFDLMAGEAPAAAPLLRIDPDGSASVAAADLLFPNGAVLTPDGSTLVVGETMGRRYTAFSVRADGSLADRRLWAEVPDVAPDGCALDAEGHIWAADAYGARAARIAPGGEVVDEVKAPDGLGVFACALGGADGRTLLLCAATGFLEHERLQARDAVLLTASVDVPHAGRP